jgi:uncharacterized protein (DUF58 family)
VKAARWCLSAFLVSVLLFVPFRIVQFLSLLFLLVLGISFLISRFASRSVVVLRRDLLLRGHRFEALEIVLTVENRSPLPVTSVAVIDTPGPLFSRQPGRFVLGLRPWERRRLSYFVESQHRGEYFVGPAEVFGADPLGMFPWQRKQDARQRLIIYPEVLPLTRPLLSGLPAGTVATRDQVYEDITRYRSLREYVRGDDARRINWKVSARMGSLVSMEYLPVLFAPALILLNLNGDDYPVRFRSHWMERATVLAASLVMHFLSLRQEIGLVALASLKGNDAVPIAPIGGTPGHAAAILEMLARIEPPRAPADFTRLLHGAGVEIPARTHVQVITPSLTDEQHAFLYEEKQKGYSVELFLLGGDEQAQRASFQNDFPVSVVTDYGAELLLP